MPQTHPGNNPRGEARSTAAPWLCPWTRLLLDRGRVPTTHADLRFPCDRGTLHAVRHAPDALHVRRMLLPSIAGAERCTSGLDIPIP
jgi:hypothetical protein